jgi:hypothetical protein
MPLVEPKRHRIRRLPQPRKGADPVSEIGKNNPPPLVDPKIASSGTLKPPPKPPKR